MTDTKWTQLMVKVNRDKSDQVCAIMEMLDNGLMIEDYNDITHALDGIYGDLIDEKLTQMDKDIVSISIFVPEDKVISDYTAYLKERFDTLNVNAEIILNGLKESDWANTWKQYYKTFKLGRKLVIVPAWESYQPQKDELTVVMDPGMAFGTGTHETTQLAAILLERNINHGDYMLDVGCGSGILAICGAKLGASKCMACDIDPVAVRVAGENMMANNVSDIVHCKQSDLLKNVDVSAGRFNIVTANIVSDIILRLLPDIHKFLLNNAIVVLSGIIVERAGEISTAICNCGFTICDQAQDNGWIAYAIKYCS